MNFKFCNSFPVAWQEQKIWTLQTSLFMEAEKNCQSCDQIIILTILFPEREQNLSQHGNSIFTGSKCNQTRLNQTKWISILLKPLLFFYFVYLNYTWMVKRHTQKERERKGKENSPLLAQPENAYSCQGQIMPTQFWCPAQMERRPK